MRQSDKQLGVSLIELMVTIAVVAILSTMASPALGSMSAGNNLNAAQENVIELLKKARGMAISHSTFATVTVDPAARTVQLSLSDGSQPNETLRIPQNISIAAGATLVFGAQGTVTAQAGAPAIDLSSTVYSALPQRHIGVSPTGVVAASR